jgi:hypothetical protein
MDPSGVARVQVVSLHTPGWNSPPFMALLHALPTMAAKHSSSGGMSAQAGTLVVKAPSIDKAKKDFETVMVTLQSLGRDLGWS